jgi:hypothetical protein
MNDLEQDTAPPGRWSTPGALVAAFAFLVALTTVFVLAGARTPAEPQTAAALVDPWCRYDCGWYMAIAGAGYTWNPQVQSPVAFFPLFPMLVRAGGWLPAHPVWLAHGIALAAGLSSVLAFRAWVRDRLPRRAATAAVGALMLYPYAVFLYGAVYADALFLALALSAFLAVERRHWWLAGLLGAAATATRPLGLALVLGLAARTLELTWPGHPEPGRAGPGARARAVLAGLWGPPWRRYAVLLSGLGVLGYAAFLGRAFGDPLAFLHAESAPGWDQGYGPRVWLKVAFWGALAQLRPIAWVLLPQALGCLAAVLLLPLLRRRLGWGYAAYTAALVALPILGTKDFMGAGRYLLNAFPVFAGVGILVAESAPPWLRRLLVSGAVVGLVAAAYLYGRGVEIA